MPTVLITGASRGIGLQFCKKYCESGWTVIAACRNPAHSAGLTDLAVQYGNLQVETLDMASLEQIDRLAQKLSAQTVDLLINNAGVYEDGRNNGFGRLDYGKWSSSFAINTLGPVKMAEAFFQQISRSKGKLIVNISSLMGSMSDNGSGGSLMYRTSKAALNAAMKSLSLDLAPSGIGILILHPGWVKTDMGGSNALIDVVTSVNGMCQVIDNFEMSQTGGFYKYDGQSLPW